MDYLVIHGGVPLQGQIRIEGAKNAALPLMTAALLTDEAIHLTSVPDLADIVSLRALLSHLGYICEGGGQSGELTLQATPKIKSHAPYDLVRKMRASILVLGPLLARLGQAEVSLPGGCAIGARPVDQHLQGLKRLGAEIEISGGYVKAKAPKGLKGGIINLAMPSVGATENLLMAACLAKGDSIINNAAREPEIADLAQLLTRMGAKIEGAGSDQIHIMGVDKLHHATHKVMADRIEAGTYLIAVAMTGGDVIIDNFPISALTSLLSACELAGVETEPLGPMRMRVKPRQHRLQGVDLTSEPYPGFPTDLQAQFMALMCLAKGASLITETIFENRFMHVPELMRMGANISFHNHAALVRGVENLTPAPVMATDLRASVSLVIAALAARDPDHAIGQGEASIINRIYHLDRGYAKLAEKLTACGAKITRAKQ